MALTRKLLASMGIEPEKIDQIIEEHSATVSGLKEERDRYKVDAEQLPEIKRQLEDATKGADDGKSWKVKHDELSAEYEKYKATISERETLEKKKTAYKEEVLKSAGILDKYMDAVLKVTDFTAVEIGEDGKVKDSAKAVEAVKATYADFCGTTTTTGANTSPSGVGSGNGDVDTDSMTDEQYYAWLETQKK